MSKIDQPTEKPPYIIITKFFNNGLQSLRNLYFKTKVIYIFSILSYLRFLI